MSRHSVEEMPTDGWEAARLLYSRSVATSAVDGRRVGELYVWLDHNGRAHLSGIPPLPWLLRDLMQEMQSCPQRILLGQGASENYSALDRGL